VFNVAVADRNLLILVSMVNFLTGVVRLSFTAAILVLEMTDRHSVIFQFLISGLLAQGVAMLIDSHSVYKHLKAVFICETAEAKRATRLQKACLPFEYTHPTINGAI
jgi:H+/Cl- antiporter ClcA